MSEKCSRCNCKRLAKIVAKCSDMCSIRYMGRSYNGEVPSSEIGSGDYIEFEYCLGCGQVQGAFPENEPEWWLEAELEDETGLHELKVKDYDE